MKDKSGLSKSLSALDKHKEIKEDAPKNESDLEKETSEEGRKEPTLTRQKSQSKIRGRATSKDSVKDKTKLSSSVSARGKLENKPVTPEARPEVSNSQGMTIQMY